MVNVTDPYEVMYEALLRAESSNARRESERLRSLRTDCDRIPPESWVLVWGMAAKDGSILVDLDMRMLIEQLREGAKDPAAKYPTLMLEASNVIEGLLQALDNEHALLVRQWAVQAGKLNDA